MPAHILVQKHSNLNVADQNNEEKVVEVSLENRDRLMLNFGVGPAGEIVDAKLSGSGCTELLTLLQSIRHQLHGVLKDIKIPEGAGHAAILMRELLLKAKGEWNFPYQEEEICHCRGISTARVDQAIVGGCHTVEAVKKATSAGSSCGTCRCDVESIIKYRI